MKTDNTSKFISELLTAILIKPYEEKLTKSQANLIDKQFAIASQLVSKAGGSLGFKFVKINKQKSPKKSKKHAKTK